MLNVTHLIPSDGIGGVEIAAKTFSFYVDESIAFRVAFMSDRSPKQTIKANALVSNIFSNVFRYYRSEVDVLIVSLWKACIVGLMVKAFKPRTRLILFLHCSKDRHILDAILTNLAGLVSDEIWADSDVTANERLLFAQKNKCKVISFVTRRFKAPLKEKVEPSFIFWGRLHAQKGLERSIRIFRAIRKKFPGAIFRVIGPDGGCLEDLKRICEDAGLNDSVMFMGPADHDRITHLARDACFYLQTSVYEGVAMSVVEAMQMGLVPVVSAVGDVGSYCHHGRNAIIVQTDEQAIHDVTKLLNSNDQYQRLRAAAIAAWRDKPLYRDSMLNACKELS